MWLLSEGDFNFQSPSGIAGIAVAIILATAAVLVTLLRRRRSDPDTVRAAAEPAVQAGVAQTTEAFVTLLAERDRKIEKLNAQVEAQGDLLDQAYQQGFQPRPQPNGGGRP